MPSTIKQKKLDTIMDDWSVIFHHIYKLGYVSWLFLLLLYETI